MRFPYKVETRWNVYCRKMQLWKHSAQYFNRSPYIRRGSLVVDAFFVLFRVPAFPSCSANPFLFILSTFRHNLEAMRHQASLKEHLSLFLFRPGGGNTPPPPFPAPTRWVFVYGYPQLAALSDSRWSRRGTEHRADRANFNCQEKKGNRNKRLRSSLNAASRRFSPRLHYKSKNRFGMLSRSNQERFSVALLEDYF